MSSQREKRKKQAQILFVKKGWNLPEIAKYLKVHPSTVARWQREDRALNQNWKTQKAANTLGEREEHLADVLNDYLAIHRQVMDELKGNHTLDAVSKARVLASLADTFNRTTKAAGNISPQIDHVALSHEILTKLSRYIITHHKQHARTFAEILENFGLALAEKNIS